MNQFVVPQFIDTEAKIIGPITVRQFVIVLIGGFVAVIAYTLADIALFVIEFLVIGSIVFLFGFFKVNGRPFHLFLINMIAAFKKPSVRVWRSLDDESKINDSSIFQVGPSEDEAGKAPINKSRLRELTLIVDTGGVFKR